MLITALIFAALAALLHVYIFVMESVTWTSHKTRATFGLTAEQAESTREMAFNQGFYNLFTAIVTVVGIVLIGIGQAASALEAYGIALVFAGIGSMSAAALVLFASSPEKHGAAMKQGIVPLIAVVMLVVAIVF